MGQFNARNNIIKNVLSSYLSEKEFKIFSDYQVSNSDIQFIKECSETILKKIPQNSFNCAMLSALLGALIVDNSSIPAVVIAGHLDFDKRRIFNCKGPIPFSKWKSIINEIWDGHCWVESNNLIIDISFFRTVYYGNVPDFLYKKVIDQYGPNKGIIIASPESLSKQGFDFTPCYILTPDQINGLILGAQRIFNI